MLTIPKRKPREKITMRDRYCIKAMWVDARKPVGHVNRQKTIWQKAGETDEDMITKAREMKAKKEYDFVGLYRVRTVYDYIEVQNG